MLWVKFEKPNQPLRQELNDEQNPHEAYSLKLDSTKAIEILRWQQQWALSEALEQTVKWYQAEKDGLNMAQFCRKQIDDFSLS